VLTYNIVEDLFFVYRNRNYLHFTAFPPLSLNTNHTLTTNLNISACDCKKHVVLSVSYKIAYELYVASINILVLKPQLHVQCAIITKYTEGL